MTDWWSLYIVDPELPEDPGPEVMNEVFMFLQDLGTSPEEVMDTGTAAAYSEWLNSHRR